MRDPLGYAISGLYFLSGLLLIGKVVSVLSFSKSSVGVCVHVIIVGECVLALKTPAARIQCPCCTSISDYQHTTRKIDRLIYVTQQELGIAQSLAEQAS